jgi:hypothetical protein
MLVKFGSSERDFYGVALARIATIMVAEKLENLSFIVQKGGDI